MMSTGLPELMVPIAHVSNDGRLVTDSFMTRQGCRTSGLGDAMWLTSAPGQPSNGEWQDMLLVPALNNCPEDSFSPALWLALPGEDLNIWWKEGAKALRVECLQWSGSWLIGRFNLRHDRLGLIFRDTSFEFDKSLKRILTQLSEVGCPIMLDLRSDNRFDPDREYQSPVLDCLVNPCRLLIPWELTPPLIYNPVRTTLQKSIKELIRQGKVTTIVVDNVPNDLRTSRSALSVVVRDLRDYYGCARISFVLPD